MTSQALKAHQTALMPAPWLKLAMSLVETESESQVIQSMIGSQKVMGREIGSRPTHYGI